MRTISSSLAIMMIACAGCRKRERFVTVPTAPVVTWSDLAGQAADVQNTYELAAPDQTQGVFPTSIAVARVALLDDRATRQRRLRLDMKPAADFLAWNSVFDDFRSIAEVFPLNIMALDGAPVTVGSLCDAARALQAGVLLLYAENHSSEHDSEIRGVLYDLPSGRVLASVHSSAHVLDPIAFDDRDDPKVSPDDHARRDARLVCVRTFESTLRDCLLALMANDEPAEPVSPEGWIPDREFEPLIWPPVEDLHRRHR